MSHSNGWIGVDLDGTLAEYHGWQGPDHVGEPVPAMLERVMLWLAEGRRVKIFTARVHCPELPYGPLNRERRQIMEQRGNSVAARRAILKWCEKHIGQRLEITNVKDYGLVELWDDRAVSVEANTGLAVSANNRSAV